MDIRSVADPTPPVIAGDDLTRDAAREINRLVKRLARMTEKELAAQVYRRAIHCLCNACHARWVVDPFGSGRST